MNDVDPVVVLGAGCAGLAAALRLAERKIPVVVLDMDDHVGGLAGGMRIRGNVYEYGPHIFHTTDEGLMASIKAMMGSDLIEYQRTIKIKFIDRYFQFPLSMTDIVRRLPLRTIAAAFFSFLRHFIVGLFVRPKEENSETLLRRYYGNVLYEIFFKHYIIHVWGITPAQMSPAFARQRVPRLNLLSELEKITARFKRRIHGPIRTDGYVEKVEGTLYTTREGFSMIMQRMAERVRALGGEIRLNTRVTGLVREGERIGAVRFNHARQEGRLACRGVINTLPINELFSLIEPRLEDPAVTRAAGALDFRALVLVGLLVKKPQVLPASFMYFREHSFNRISDLSYFGFDIQPKGATLLIAETTCGAADRAWTDDAFIKEGVIADLVAEKLLSREDILEAHCFRARYAYPIYSLGYEGHLQTLLQAVDGIKNMETAGRQGRFQYVNTHIVMTMAAEAVDRLQAALAE